MKRITTILLASSLLALLLTACTGGQNGQTAEEAAADSLSQEVAAEEVAEPASPTDLIDGMQEAEMPDAGLKAWIDECGDVYWNVYDEKKYQEATSTYPEFFRIGDGPQKLQGLPEFPIGVYLAKLNSKGDVALYVITHRHHVYALDISLEVSQVGGGLGLIEGLEDVESIRMEGRKVMAVDSKGQKKRIEFYSGEGPYQCEVMCGEKSYAFEFSSTWNMRLVVDGTDYYSGRFHRGENGYYTFTLSRHYRLDNNYKEVDVPMSPMSGSFHLNVKKSTLMFDTEVAGLPREKALGYEVYPLFD